MEERGEGGLGVVEVQGAVYIERSSGFFGTLDRCEQQANGTRLAAKTVFVRCESHPPSETMRMAEMTNEASRGSAAVAMISVYGKRCSHARDAQR